MDYRLNYLYAIIFTIRYKVIEKIYAKTTLTAMYMRHLVFRNTFL
jgi:hypothetical protein